MGYFLASLSKEQTQIGLDICEWLLLAFAIIVVIGIVGEHKTPWWRVRYDFFALLVAFGCGGEVLADGGVFLFSKHLQVISDIELSHAQLDVADAMLLANSAKTTAELFGVIAAEAKTKAEGFRLQIAQANERASNALLGQEQLKSENLKLEKELLMQGDREKLLAGEPRRILIDSLKPFAGQKIDVQCELMLGSWDGISTGTSSSFGEISGLAKAIIGVLTEAGWNAPKALSNIRSALPGNGVGVHVSPDASTPTRKSAEALVKSLGGVPLAVSGPTPDLAPTKQPSAGELDRDAILLVVREKPK